MSVERRDFFLFFVLPGEITIFIAEQFTVRESNECGVSHSSYVTRFIRSIKSNAYTAKTSRFVIITRDMWIQMSYLFSFSPCRSVSISLSSRKSTASESNHFRDSQNLFIFTFCKRKEMAWIPNAEEVLCVRVRESCVTARAEQRERESPGERKSVKIFCAIDICNRLYWVEHRFSM